MSNVYKNNIELLSTINNNDVLTFTNYNELKCDNSYFSYFNNNIKKVIEIYYISFLNYLTHILISKNYTNLLFLKTSLTNLKSYISYNKYHSRKIQEKIKILENILINFLEQKLPKSNNNTNLSFNNDKEPKILINNLDIIQQDNSKDSDIESIDIYNSDTESNAKYNNNDLNNNDLNNNNLNEDDLNNNNLNEDYLNNDLNNNNLNADDLNKDDFETSDKDKKKNNIIVKILLFFYNKVVKIFKFINLR